MSALPEGTVTFLFTDVEGSTRLLHELGDHYAEVLAEHRRVLREAFARHGGVEVDTQGDAFFVAFARASDALAAAAEARAGLADGPIRVRIGLHTGEPLVTDEGYVGMDVHRAARIAAAGYGGQILVSQSTRDLVGDADLRDLGEHRLKDLTAPERIYQLGGGEFAPLKTLNATNLPVAASALVGRERELAELQALMRNGGRVVTLTGPGGSGKTRLALQLAAEVVDDFRGGIFFVPLAGVANPDLVESTITRTIGINALAELGDREALLLIDNFEHLLDAAPVVASLLAATTNAKVLATSRAPLRVDAEREYAVEPLPDDDAVELLTERARAVRPDFAPDDAAREICRRLDGLPLALELAAARLRSLGSTALLERLEHTLPVLTSGRRDAPERQRTLRATIEWSYDLLPPELQRVFARLSVFATFTLEAAEAVADTEFEEVDALVEASLVKPLADDRFLMLETIREFARERLNSAEADELHRRHAEFYAELAASANLQEEAEGPMQHQLVARDFNNMRAALTWAVEAGAGEVGLRMAISLENFWVTGTDPAEGRRWLEALLPLAPPPPSELHALALRCIGNCSVMLAEPEKGISLYEQSLDEFRQLEDEVRVGISLHRIATNSAYLGDFERAASMNDQSLALNRRLGFKRGEASSLALAGDLERKAGNVERGLELYEQAHRIFRETNFTWWEKNCLLQKSMALFELGRPAGAGESAREALRVAERMGDRYGILDSLAFVARAALETGDLQLAGRLWGAVTADVERQPVPGWEQEVARLWPNLAGESAPAFRRDFAEGRGLATDEAIVLALQEPPGA